MLDVEYWHFSGKTFVLKILTQPLRCSRDSDSWSEDMLQSESWEPFEILGDHSMGLNSRSLCWRVQRSVGEVFIGYGRAF